MTRTIGLVAYANGANDNFKGVAATGHARWKTLAAIVGAWVITLPLAAGLAAAAYAFSRFW